MAEKESQDWIELFLEYTDGINSPEAFRLWAGIVSVAGILERRVWSEIMGSQLYANLYTLLVSTPGVGKTQAILRTSKVWMGTKQLHVAANSVSRASLVDAVAKAQRIIIKGGLPLDYHSLQVASWEFGTLVPSYDLDFLNHLNELYDCGPYFREEKRMFKNSPIDISNPQLNMLAGTQPAYLSTLLPDEAWGMGFMTRVIMVYSSEMPRRPKLFTNGEDRKVADPALLNELIRRAVDLFTEVGVVQWSSPAQLAFQSWVDSGMPPVPEHPRLEAYNTRRLIHVPKLAMISAASAGHALNVELPDFHRALAWLLDAEQTMPDVFRAMHGKSDMVVLRELYQFAWEVYAKSKKPIHESRLVAFLSARVPSDKIEKILSIALKSQLLIKGDPYPDEWKPAPKAGYET